MRGVQAYHLGQAPRVYSFDRKLYDRAKRARSPEPEQRPFNPPKQAMPLGLGGAFGGATHILAAPPYVLSSYFPGAYQVLQTDRGLTMGTTPYKTGTTPPIGTLGGTLTRDGAKPLWFKCTTAGTIGGGALFSAYADGAGVVPFATGISPAGGGSPVALGGSFTGTNMAWAAGTAALDNVWKGTCSALADQSGGGFHVTQPQAANQPIIIAGPNGKCGLRFDVSRATCMAPSGLTIVAATPFVIYWVANLTLAGSDEFFASNSGNDWAFYIGAPTLYINGAAIGAGGTFSVNSRIVSNVNGASSFVKNGSVSTPGTFGVYNVVQPQIGGGSGFPTAARLGNMDFYAQVYAPLAGANVAGADTALNLSTGYGPGAIAV